MTTQSSQVTPLTVPKALWEKYSTRAPRYTSYPTAPLFTETFDKDAASTLWQSSFNEDTPYSIYVHIPFCQKRCLYCGCHTFVRRDQSIAEPYVDALLGELDLLLETYGRERQIAQLALGGGTPTFLSIDQFKRFADGLHERLTFKDGAELSIEVDPRSVDEAYLDLLVDSGFNRFSFGIQDFDTTVMTNVGRPQDEANVRKLFAYLRSRDVQGINFDLIFGLPGQTPETMKATVEKVNEIGPTRIALFSYAHLPTMKPHQKTLEKYGIPGDQEKIAILGTAYDGLVDGGYVPIGMDHFAKPHDELHKALETRSLHRNFMGYTTNRGVDIVGIGVSAISAVNQTYVQNVKELDTYYESLENKQLPWQRGYLMSKDDVMRRELIIDLFCNFHLDIKAFEGKFDLNFWETFAKEHEQLEPLRDDGLLELNDEEITVLPLGRFFVRNICKTFDVYLNRTPSTTQFSKTV